jgi:hypothetical protein
VEKITVRRKRRDLKKIRLNQIAKTIIACRVISFDECKWFIQGPPLENRDRSNPKIDKQQSIRGNGWSSAGREASPLCAFKRGL